MELDLANGRNHHHRRLVGPVEGEGRSESLRVEIKVVHVVPDPDTHDAHAALEAELLDLERNEPALRDVG